MYRYLLATLLLCTSVNVWSARHCVILQYHHFSANTPAITSVTPQQFDAHLDYLASNGFTVMALRDVVLALYHQLELPDKCVSLSVDDAYISVYDTAYPRLKARGWPMTVFVSSKPVDGGLNSFMSWEQMREMAGHGFSFENHGHGHIHMIRPNPDENERAWLTRIGNDIQTAQQRITQEIGVAPTLFAWPYGEYNMALVHLLERMNLVGFGQQSGPAWPDANFAYLPRFPMAAQYADLKGFVTKVNTLPLPVIRAEPAEPLTALGEVRPRLTLTLVKNQYSRDNLRCYISGSDQVEMHWTDGVADTLEISPRFDLAPGRHRVNCTMPSRQKGRFHWYSHNWFVRTTNGGWYAEY
jgi:biofilm PGA synthesis lipoprotein PgaB